MRKTNNIHPYIRDMLKGCLPEPVVIRVTKFDDEAVASFSKQMSDAHANDQQVIPIIIDSFGGSVYSLLAMIAEIQNSDSCVATIVEGKAMSAGAMLFLMGGVRYMAPTATLMIHDISNVSYGKLTEMQSDVEEATRLRTLIFGLIAENCDHGQDQLFKHIQANGNTDWFLTAKTAKKLGLCTHIKIPELLTEVSYEVSLK